MNDPVNRRSLKPDTQADLEVKACTNAMPSRSFVMVAGAGSGKTTSLIKALANIVTTHGPKLKQRRQRVACITYTEIAAREIWADVGNNPLVHVSTIHSFLWMITRTFQTDIRQWVVQRIDERIDELKAKAAAFGPKVQKKTRDKNERDVTRLESQRGRIASVAAFKYGVGSDYPKGILGHDDVIRMSTSLLQQRGLFRSIVAQQFPFVFVDESQDTTQTVVDSLQSIQKQAPATFCLGFFGDPMQQIYATGIGPIPDFPGWAKIQKTENFRCPVSVLQIANAIRRGDDGLVQTGGRTAVVGGAVQPVVGTARFFVLPADEHRATRLNDVRAWLARENADPQWQAAGGDGVKVLVIVHRMAATRLGFAELYAALNDKSPDAFKSGFLDATAWPLRPFISFILPLCAAMRDKKEFDALSVLRSESPLLAKDALPGKNVAEMLAGIRRSSLELTDLMRPGNGATVKQALEFVRRSGLYSLDPRVIAYLEEGAPKVAASAEKDDDGEESTREIAAMEAFFECPASQLWAYRDYVKEQSPFSTQQGIKGSEFLRVLVVLDDEESTHYQFSYDRYLGLKPPSEADVENASLDKDTSIDRTRRLFYVCCTRAMKDLAVVLFAQDPAAAERQVRKLNLFPNDQIFGPPALG